MLMERNAETNACKFFTDDGKAFDNIDKACAHEEEVKQLKEISEKYGITFFDTDKSPYDPEYACFEPHWIMPTDAEGIKFINEKTGLDIPEEAVGDVICILCDLDKVVTYTTLKKDMQKYKELFTDLGMLVL